MSLIVNLAHLSLALLLFFAVNWIGEHSTSFGYLNLSLTYERDSAPAFNFILKSLSPTVYTILVATTLYLFHQDRFITHIWIVALYYFSIRILYNLLMSRLFLMNWASVISQSLLGTGAAYVAYVHLILPRHPLFPSRESIGEQLWTIIAVFLYATLNNVRTSSAASVRRKNRYLRRTFTDLKAKYGNLIEGQFPEKYMELVAYAVLIYETFNRPRLARLLERAVFPWGSHSLGPMQVRTNARISDRESVKIGVRQLRESFETTEAELAGKVPSRYHLISSSLAKYNRDSNYIGQVFTVIHVLWAQIVPEYRLEFENMYAVP